MAGNCEKLTPCAKDRDREPLHPQGPSETLSGNIMTILLCIP